MQLYGYCAGTWTGGQESEGWVKGKEGRDGQARERWRERAQRERGEHMVGERERKEGKYEWCI